MTDGRDILKEEILTRLREALDHGVTCRGRRDVLGRRYLGAPTTLTDVCRALRRNLNWGRRREREGLSQLGRWLRAEPRQAGRSRGPTTDLLLWYAETAVPDGVGNMHALRATDPLAALAMLLVAYAPTRGPVPDVAEVRSLMSETRRRRSPQPVG